MKNQTSDGVNEKHTFSKKFFWRDTSEAVFDLCFSSCSSHNYAQEKKSVQLMVNIVVGLLEKTRTSRQKKTREFHFDDQPRPDR